MSPFYSTALSISPNNHHRLSLIIAFTVDFWLCFIDYLRAVELGNKLQVAVLFVIIKAVTDHENIGDIEAFVIDGHFNDPARFHINQGANF